MPIRAEKLKLIDDTRTFTAEELTDVWEWLDSFDKQPLRSREGAKLEKESLAFTHDQYAFRGITYSIAKCSDGRAILGSPLNRASQ